MSPIKQSKTKKGRETERENKRMKQMSKVPTTGDLGEGDARILHGVLPTFLQDRNY